MTKETEPLEGQTWKHRQYGLLMEVVDVFSGTVRMRRTSGGAVVSMRVEQISEHYELVETQAT
jgi:hypothetical protein